HVELPLDELDVAARRVRQLVELRDSVERLVPARQDAVYRPAVMEVALVRGKLVRLRAVAQVVTRADGALPERGEHGELPQRERGEAVQPRRVAERDQIEPAAAALPAGHGPELAPELADALLRGTLDLGRERALADARDVRLGDADDGVDARRADPDPGRRAAGDGWR